MGNGKANRIPEEMRKYKRNIANEANLHFVDLFFFKATTDVNRTVIYWWLMDKIIMTTSTTMMTLRMLIITVIRTMAKTEK